MSMIYFTPIAFILVMLISINIFLLEEGYISRDREENSSYECGFEHNSLSRVPLSVRYFLLTVVFLVFDLEVVLLVFLAPGVMTMSSMIMTLVCLTFIVLLLLGLFYEWVDGSLDWVM